MKSIKTLLLLAAAGSMALASAQTGQKSAAEVPTAPSQTSARTAVPEAVPGAPVRELTAVNIEYQGSKIWVPSTFIVKKGEKVRLTLINNAPSGPHGFAIDEFAVKVVVADKGKKVIEFTTDKAGLFRSYCQMHPAHVGGEVLVIE